MSERYVDVHCHLFDHDMIALKLRTIQDLLGEIGLEKLEDNVGFTSFIQFIGNIIQIITAPLTSDFIFKNMNKYYKQIQEADENWSYVPLMMDVSYILSDRKKKTIMKIQKGEKIRELDEKAKKHLDNLKEQLDIQSTEIIGRFGINIDFNQYKSFKSKIINQLDIQKENIDKLYNPESYYNQIEELKKIKKEFPGKIHPFLAVDPARPDILNIVQKYVGTDEKNLFHGIKIYTQCGFSPTDPVMMKIYEYCEDEKIPITAHFAKTGFATLADEIYVNGYIYIEEKNKIRHYIGKREFKNKLIDLKGKKIIKWKKTVRERSIMLNHPLLWEEVLRKFSKLYLNFAHFGGRSEMYKNYIHGNDEERRYSWTAYVLRFMENYDNVYSDISCYPSTRSINYMKDFKANVYDKSSNKVKNKTLYGSDYFLLYLYTDDFREYITNAKEVFGSEFTKIAMHNTRSFLQLP